MLCLWDCLACWFKQKNSVMASMAAPRSHHLATTPLVYMHTICLRKKHVVVSSERTPTLKRPACFVIDLRKKIGDRPDLEWSAWLTHKEPKDRHTTTVYPCHPVRIEHATSTLSLTFIVHSHRIRTQPTFLPNFFVFWHHLGSGPSTGSSCLNIAKDRTFVEPLS